jgi:hypothetical protein
MEEKRASGREAFDGKFWEDSEGVAERGVGNGHKPENAFT